MKGLEGDLGENIDGPSLIRVPDWISNPLGKYYLYFAAHHGKYIRLATADHLEGPWTIYAPGVLNLSSVPGGIEQIGSPDVHVDPKTKEWRMYFHSWAMQNGEKLLSTFVATSTDGLHYTVPTKEILGHGFSRTFEYDGFYYSIGMYLNKDCVFMRSKDGMSNFVDGPHCLPKGRHNAVWIEGKTLYIVYSNVADAPEQLYISTVDLSPDWMSWKVSPPEKLLASEMDYEGVNLPIAPSKHGYAKGGSAHELRDPAIFEEDGKRYLLYSVASECGIAIAELKSGEK